MRGTAIGIPSATGADDAAFGRHYDLRPVPRPGRESTRDESLVVTYVAIIEAVGVRGVDQSGAGVEGGLDDLDTLGLGGTSLNREMHSAETHGGDRRPVGAERPEPHVRIMQVRVGG
jgi:hypothetical protein